MVISLDVLYCNFVSRYKTKAPIEMETLPLVLAQYKKWRHGRRRRTPVSKGGHSE